MRRTFLIIRWKNFHRKILLTASTKLKSRKMLESSIVALRRPTIPHINSETNPSPPWSMLFPIIWDSFLAKALVLLLFPYPETLSRGRGLIYFCKVDHSRISINFSRNWLGLNNLCEILSKNLRKLGKQNR